MAEAKVTPPTFNARITAMRFFFGMTCDREDMKKYMQFCTEPRKLLNVLSLEDVSAVLAPAPGPGMKYRAALSIRCPRVVCMQTTRGTFDIRQAGSAMALQASMQR